MQVRYKLDLELVLEMYWWICGDLSFHLRAHSICDFTLLMWSVYIETLFTWSFAYLILRLFGKSLFDIWFLQHIHSNNITLKFRNKISHVLPRKWNNYNRWKEIYVHLNPIYVTLHFFKEYAQRMHVLQVYFSMRWWLRENGKMTRNFEFIKKKIVINDYNEKY